MSALSTAATTAILHSLWQGTVIALLLWVSLRVMRRASATSRYVVSCVALMAMVLLPLVTFVDALTDAESLSAATSPTVGRPPDLPMVTADGSRIWSDRSVTPPGILASLEAWIVPLCLAGVTLASLRLVWAGRHVRSVRRSGVPAPNH